MEKTYFFVSSALNPALKIVRFSVYLSDAGDIRPIVTS